MSIKGFVVLVCIVILIGVYTALLFHVETRTITKQLDVQSVKYLYDTGFHAYDRTIITGTGDIVVLIGIEYIPLGNVTLVLNPNGHEYFLVSVEKC
jgi:hypothetical protein